MTRKRGGTKNNRADLIESIRNVVTWLKTQESDELSPDIALSVDRLTAFVAAFDKLAPDWSKAPIEANYYTVSNSGLCRWHVDEPQINDVVQSWNSEYVLPPRFALHVELQDGIDWKLCKFQRPKVAAVEILARQVRSLSNEIEHLEAAGNLTWKSIRGIGKAVFTPSTYTFKTIIDAPNRYQGADGVLYDSEDDALNTWRKAKNLPPDYEPKWINVTTSGMGHNRYVLHTPPVNPH